ncbi:MAG TPA: RNA methyltransferase [Salegentibacter sp.]|nr:RNA methyltransferase [Salegentibacter sp.]
MEKQQLLDHLKSFLTPRRNKLFEEVLSKRTNFFTVVTQDVHQLHNTSAVIRSCDVFGIQNIHVIEERQPRRIDKEIAMGAQKWVDVNRYNSTNDCISNLRGKGYQIVATTPYGDARNLEEFEISKPSAVFFGTEKDGLSEEVLKEADVRLKIPMQGFTESLNISVSAAIILQSLTSRLRNSDQFWQLTSEEKLAIEFHWAKKCIKNSEQLLAQYESSR